VVVPRHASKAFRQSPRPSSQTAWTWLRIHFVSDEQKGYQVSGASDDACHVLGPVCSVSRPFGIPYQDAAIRMRVVLAPFCCGIHGAWQFQRLTHTLRSRPSACSSCLEINHPFRARKHLEG